MAKRKRKNPPSMPSQRQLRAGELVRHALVDVLTREEMLDPDLENVSVTIGEVRCSPDLKHARVFCSPLGDDSAEARSRMAAGLNRAASYLRGRLGREIDMKFTPKLFFIADDSYDEARAIDRLLSQPEVARDLARED